MGTQVKEKQALEGSRRADKHLGASLSLQTLPDFSLSANPERALTNF